MIHKVEMELGGKTLSLETGRLAKLADGAVLGTYGESVVLVAVCGAREARPGFDFLPLTVDYREMTYASGRIPGGFFKREGRPTEKEILTSRMIDRPIRPCFADGYRCEIKVDPLVMSADKENDPDVVAMVTASAAVMLSGIPFDGPLGSLRVARVGGELVANPTYEQRKVADLAFVVAGNKNNLMMVEGGAAEVDEAAAIDALLFAHEQIKKLVELQEKLCEKAGREVWDFTPPQGDAELEKRVAEVATGPINEASQIAVKQDRYDAYSRVKKEAIAALGAEYEGREKEIKEAVEGLKKKVVRSRMRETKVRIDGRGLADIRPITSDVGVLPRTHGSALFTRGETQALATTTLGSKRDEQKIEDLGGGYYRNFMLHYKFPPWCVGEARPNRGPSRREIGHGALAHRALERMLPDPDDFPYTVRIVSEVLESNGSSSMASICGGTLALMDAGVPIKAPVAGIAMGLIKEEGDFLILSDILGDEDHLGDMDFKVAGTAKGITALQMDIKCDGVDRAILETALAQAKEGRIHILKKMASALSAPRENVAEHAPRFITIRIPQDRIKDVIGPGGRVIRGIQEETGATIEVEGDGTVRVFATDSENALAAQAKIEAYTQEAEIGKIYPGTVKRVMDFGAFVEILPGIEGLVHISHLSPRRVRSTDDVCEEGDEMLVRVLDVDRQGKIRLSRKEALSDEETAAILAEAGEDGDDDRDDRRDRDDRGGRGGDRGGRR